MWRGFRPRNVHEPSMERIGQECAGRDRCLALGGLSPMILPLPTQNPDGRGMFVSCEMDRRSLGDRLLSRVTAIHCERISRALVTDEQAAALQNAISAWADQPIRIIEASAPTVQQIGAWARAETARYGLDFAVVDHIGLLRSSTRMRNAYESATEIAKDLKSLATALRMPVL
jgi:replicative DNA helicase